MVIYYKLYARQCKLYAIQYKLYNVHYTLQCIIEYYYIIEYTNASFGGYKLRAILFELKERNYKLYKQRIPLLYIYCYATVLGIHGIQGISASKLSRVLHLFFPTPLYTIYQVS